MGGWEMAEKDSPRLAARFRSKPKHMTRLLLLFVCVGASAQTAHVRVDGAGEVVVDGAVAGPAGAWLAVAPGERVVALVDDAQAWNPRRAQQTVTVREGDSVSVALRLPRRVRVETLPIRALVVREYPDGRRDTLGTAPLDLDLRDGEMATLVATLGGYDAVRQSVEGGAPVQTLMLRPEAGAPAERALLPTERSTARRTLIDLGIGAATLAAGVVAVSYKFRADAADDRYRSPLSADFGDEAFRDEALRLDRYSAAALGAMQVGVGALALRFVLR